MKNCCLPILLLCAACGTVQPNAERTAAAPTAACSCCPECGSPDCCDPGCCAAKPADEGQAAGGAAAPCCPPGNCAR